MALKTAEDKGGNYKNEYVRRSEGPRIWTAQFERVYRCAGPLWSITNQLLCAGVENIHISRSILKWTHTSAMPYSNNPNQT